MRLWCTLDKDKQKQKDLFPFQAMSCREALNSGFLFVFAAL